MGVLVFQVQQFLKEHPSKVWLVGTAGLPEEPPLLVDGKLPEKFGDASRLQLEIVPAARPDVWTNCSGQRRRRTFAGKYATRWSVFPPILPIS